MRGLLLLLQVLWRRMCTCRSCLVLGALLLWWGWRRPVCSSCRRWDLTPQGMQVGALCTSNVYIHTLVLRCSLCCIASGLGCWESAGLEAGRQDVHT